MNLCVESETHPKVAWCRAFVKWQNKCIAHYLCECENVVSFSGICLAYESMFSVNIFSLSFFIFGNVHTWRETVIRKVAFDYRHTNTHTHSALEDEMKCKKGVFDLEHLSMLAKKKKKKKENPFVWSSSQVSRNKRVWFLIQSLAL